jgi:hypothetical protein
METVIRRIIADPRSWNQAMWAHINECGTSYCFAGHAVVASGYEFLRLHDRLWDQFVVVPENSALSHIAHPTQFEMSEGSPKPFLAARPSVAARTLLGIDRDDADLLFDSTNTFPEILAFVEKLAADDGYDWPEDLRLTEEQRAAMAADDLMLVEDELLYPNGESSL